MRNALMAEIEKFLSDQSQLPRRGLNREGIIYVLPEDWDQQQAKFQEIASSLGEEFQMNAPLASDSAELLDAPGIDALPGVGAARSTKFGRTPTTTAQYVMAAHEFGNSTAIPSQQGIASPVFKDAAGNLYIFRVIETDSNREARSIDEVREQVTADTRTLDRFKALEAKAPELETQAIEYGLQPIAEKYETEVIFSPNLAEADARLLAYGIKSPTRIRGLTDSQSVIDAIIARAGELDYTMLATDLPAKDRTLVIPDEESLAVAVVQITSIKPLTNEAWSELASKGGIIRVLATEETALDFTETFSLDALMNRHGFKLLRPQDEDLDADVDPDADNGDATASTDAPAETVG